MPMKYDLKLEGRIKEMEPRFLYLIVLPLLTRNPVRFRGFFWVPLFSAVLFQL